MALPSFPENCFYCTSKYRSQHCLLSYEIIKNFVIPEDPIAATIGIVELHSTADSFHLSYSAGLASWHASQASTSDLGEQTHSAHNTAHTHGPVQAEQPEKQAQIEPSLTQQIPEIQGPATPKLPEHTLKLSAETVHPTGDTPTAARQPKPDSETQDSDASYSLVSHAKPQKGQPQPKALSVTTSDFETPETWNFKNVVHLCDDTYIAAIASQTLRKHSKRYHTVESFKAALVKECNIKITYSNNYRPDLLKPLDHPTSIARQFASSHDTHILRSWKDGTLDSNPDRTGCLLHHPHFLNTTEEYDKYPLDNSLMLYSLLTTRNSNDSSLKTELIEPMRNLFITKNRKTIFEWLLKTNPKEALLNDSKYLSTPRRASALIETPTQSTFYAQHKCPEVSERVKKLIETKINHIVESTLTDAGDVPFEPGTQKTCHERLNSLTIEVISHHPEWEKPTFTVDLTILRESANFANFHLGTQDVPAITFLLNQVLKELKG